MAKLATLNNEKTIITLTSDKKGELEVGVDAVFTKLKSGATKLISLPDFRKMTGLKGRDAARMHSLACNCAGRVMSGFAAMQMQKEGFSINKLKRVEHAVRRKNAETGKVETVGTEHAGWDFSIRKDKKVLAEATPRAPKKLTIAERVAAIKAMPKDERDAMLLALI